MPLRKSPRGAERIRTAVRGFAGLCLTTRPRRPDAGHGIRGSFMDPAFGLFSNTPSVGTEGPYPHASFAPAAIGRFDSSAWKHR
jgi:hypothetical protein